MVQDSGHDRFALNKMVTVACIFASFLLYRYVKSASKKAKATKKEVKIDDLLDQVNKELAVSYKGNQLE